MSTSIQSLIIYCIVSTFSGCTTFLLCKYTKLTKVQASALPTFLFALTMLLFIDPQNRSAFCNILISIFFGASFIGMTSSKVSSLADIFLGSILFAILYFFADKRFHAFGGKLGIMACIALVISIGFRRLCTFVIANLSRQKHFVNKSVLPTIKK